MENYAGCREEVLELVKDADLRFGKTWHIPAPRMAALEAVCECFDRVAESADPEQVDIRVDERTGDFIFGMESLDLVLQYGERAAFLDALGEMTAFRVRFLRPDRLRTEFRFSGLWEHI